MTSEEGEGGRGRRWERFEGRGISSVTEVQNFTNGHTMLRVIGNPKLAGAALRRPRRSA